MMSENNLTVVLDVFADKIRSLKTEVMVKDMEICKLREENMHLRPKAYGAKEGAADGTN